MITPGKFDVGSTGAFTYDIPIAVPPGTAGIAPALTLDYSSQAADGILGLGWSLGGLPSIGRCSRTVAQDGVHGGVNYDLNDRFCLGGQRLVLTSGTYGADGSQYRTEIDSFSLIIAHSQTGSGPTWFEVHTKSGQIMEFGNSTDSRVLAVGKTTVRAWGVDKISDTVGNYMTVTYTTDAANGENYPSRIDYTGNTAASLATYNSVQFSYETRPDITPFYQAGSLTQRTQLLTDVKTYAGSTLVADYKLAYMLGSTTRHSELTSIAQCNGSGACLPATTFGWQGSRDTPTMTALANGEFQGNATQLGTLVPGSFAGDGLTDLYVSRTLAGLCGVFYGTQTAGVFTSTNQMSASYELVTYDPESGEYTRAWTPNTSIPCQNRVFTFRFPLDFNGDGLTDVMISQPVSHTQVDYFSLVNNGAGALIQPGTGSAGENYFLGPQSGDFNGDGRADILLANGGTGYSIYIGTGTGDFAVPTSGSASYVNYFVGDFDGDGCSDLLGQGASSSGVIYSCNPASATGAAPSLATAQQIILGDFNGDGKSDLLVATTSGATLYLSTGTGFTSGYAIPSSSDWYKYEIVTGDWNGDGKTDIALIAAGNSGGYGVGTSHRVFISTGVGFNLLQTITNTNSADTKENAVSADLNNDGAADFWLQKPSGDTEYLFSYVPELINSVTNGIGVTTTVTYDRINRATVYTPQTGDAYPTQDLNGPLYVVSTIASSNAVGGTYNSTYAYTGAKLDLQGRGFLGFSAMTVTDSQTGVVQTTNFLQTFPYIGMMASRTKVLGSVTLNATTNTFATTTSAGAAQFVHLTQTVKASTDLDGTAMPTVTTTYNSYDAYGNATQITTSTPDGATQVTTNTYTNDTTHWYLGRLTGSSVASTVGSSNITRTSSFAYDSGTGLLTQEIVEPSTAALKLETDYVYDAFGNKHTATVSGGSGSSAIATRTTTTTYDSRGQFPATVANALSQSETWGYNSAYGSPATHAGPNGLTTSWTYDGFGRPLVETRPDNSQTSQTYLYCAGVNGSTASCPTNAAFLVQTTTLGSDHSSHVAPVTTTYYDALSRVIAKEAEGFDGTVIHTDSQFDANGRPYRQSLPYFVGASSVYWTVTTFDALGRAATVTQPNTGVTTYGYHGLTTTVTDPNSHTMTTVKNDQGLAASVTDAASKTTSYVYDAEGDLLTVTDSAGNVTTNTFDIRGRKTAVSDPDKGAWSYGYDALSELVSQTNANAQTTTVAYDVLGRMTSRTEISMTSTWTYDTATHGVGALAQAATNSGYSRTFTYDTLSRPTTVALSYNGSNATFTTTYDPLVTRVSTVTYPSGLAVKYAYNTRGYATQLTDNTSGATYWTGNARDQFLHLISETAGNGVVTTRTYTPQTGLIATIHAGTSNTVASFDYQFDLIGNLTQRTDDNLARTDSFTYDALDRMATYALAGGAVQTMGYDALGSITSKPGIGTYAYPAAGQPRPHAVSSITGTVRGIVNPTFTYDADGNQLSGPGIAAAYTSFDMPGTVWSGQPATIWGSFTWGTASWGGPVNLAYDSEHQRVSMAGPSSTTLYWNDPISGVKSEFVTPVSGSAIWRDDLMADGRMVAERTAVTGGATSFQYFVQDHLGSIAVSTDSSGAVIERMIYDPWGEQLDQSGNPLCGSGTPTTRGYTGEEQFPVGCLVNLNARLYDPILGRFMVGDPVIATVYDQQSLNRYAYVRDNPLSLTDTNGQCPICAALVVNAIFDFIFAEALKPVLQEAPILGDLFVIADAAICGPICAAEAGGTVAGVESGSVGKGFKAFVITLAEAQVFHYVGDDLEGLKALNQAGLISDFRYYATAFVEHGLVGGVFSALQGRNVGAGFLAAGVGELASPYVDTNPNNPTLGTIEEAIIGGTTSVITGGSFGNGAITSSFGYLFNQFAHNGRDPSLRHQIIADESIASYEANGYVLISAVPVAVNIPGFSTPRYYDLLFYDPIVQVYIGVEVKTTLYDTIFLKSDQVAKDAALMVNGGFAPKLNLTIRGVGYLTHCFSCDIVDLRSSYLADILGQSGIPIYHYSRAGVVGP